MNINKRFYLTLRHPSVFFEYFFYFFNLLFLFFIIYLFLLNSYLFCGDISHGKGSYLLIMHSTLAITSKFLWYFYMFLILLLAVLYINKYNNYYFFLLSYIVYKISIYGLIHTCLFLITGMIWGDYSWGFPVSVEFRFLNLLLLCLTYLLFIIVGYVHLFNIYNALHGFAFNLIITLLLGFNFFDLLSTYPQFYFILDFFSIHIKRYELHQSDESLHFFLISISGYYISIIFVYLFYILFTLFYQITCHFCFFVLSVDSYTHFFYLRNLKKVHSMNATSYLFL